MPISIPPEDLWLQYPVLGIVVLVLILVAVALRIAWHDFTIWQEKQDKARADERNAQREWEEEQARAAEQERRTREQNWQEFFEKLNDQNRAAISGNSNALEQLIKVNQQLVGEFNIILEKLTEHDNFVRANTDTARPAERRRVSR